MNKDIDKGEKYNPKKIEPYWQKKWEEVNLYKAIDFDQKPKKYILVEFPYPSGERLHVGHGRSYTALDAMARFYRMKGYNVLFPLGWDAFGLPAENYAIKTGINPAITTRENIKNAKAQAKRWGLSIDWSREINTTDPKYYKWTQWIFLKLYEHNLAYWAEAPVNWCPFCKTTLADEEVLANGNHERCGNPTERRMQKQWILKITAYADRLLEDLKEVDYLPQIASQQINWIGKTEGIIIDYPVIGSDKIVSCYTTRPDTNFGATFIVVAPEHPFVDELLNSKFQIPNSKKEEIKEYVQKAKRKSELERVDLAKEKTGVFTSLYALNRLTGKKMPIWIADFVILTAGTGIVVGVPAHDKRDWEFAKKYNLEIIPVIKPKDKSWDFDKAPFVDIDESIVFNSDFLNGLTALKAKEKITQYLVEKGWGKKAVNYHLRDWIFSRQHYWGEPIPIIHCPRCGIVSVPEKDLPVGLPYVEKYQPTETGESPLANIKEWVNTKCPKCGMLARRETDTMPNWAGSNWYYVAYILAPKLQVSIKSGKNIFEENKELLKYWLPVDLYNGGMEHTNLHLLYSRFIYKFLYDIGAVPTKEPYVKRRSHGVVLGSDGFRMSKSRGNVINPDSVVEAFGADAFRLYESFMGPFDQTIAWSQEGLEGCYRFLNKVWNLVTKNLKSEKIKKPKSIDLQRKLNQTIKKVGEDIQDMKFNTAIAAMMEFVNLWQKDKNGLSKEDVKKFLLILAPFAPHITEELWSKLGNKFSIHQQKWPEYDPDLIVEKVVTIAVQVNGKLRSTIQVERSKCKVQNEVVAIAKNNEKVKRYLADREIKKTIFVPGKLINFFLG